jgi:hypothetical protein
VEKGRGLKSITFNEEWSTLEAAAERSRTFGELRDRSQDPLSNKGETCSQLTPRSISPREPELLTQSDAFLKETSKRLQQTLILAELRRVSSR